MISTRRPILLLVNLGYHYSLTVSCNVSVHIVNRRNQCEITTEVLIIDGDNG